MGIPVWVTVIICRLLGAFIIGFLGVAVLAGLLITNPVGTTAPQSALVTYSLVVTVVSAAVIGLVMTGPLPPLRPLQPRPPHEPGRPARALIRAARTLPP
jgi:hypothetical protein